MKSWIKHIIFKILEKIFQSKIFQSKIFQSKIFRFLYKNKICRILWILLSFYILIFITAQCVMILADFAIFFYLNYLKVYLKVGYEPIKYIIPIPEEASNRMLRGSQVMEERILINADINYLKDFIREEQKVKGCYFRFDYILKDVGYFVYLIFNDNFIMYDLVNCYIDKFDKDITIYNKCNIVHKDIVISKKYVNFYKHYCESSFIREMLFISLCENYSVCKEELKVLLEYKNIQEQYNIRWDINCWTALVREYTKYEGRRIEVLKDLYDLFLAVTVYPNVIELGDLLQAKRNYNNQFNLIDMLSASLNKDLFKVSKAKMFEWLWLNSQFDRSWSISDIVYAEHNCKIPEEVFRKSKTTIRTNDLVVYQMMLLHHYIYGQFSTEEFLTLLRLQNHYPETLDLCRILKNIDPTMTMDKIGEILYLDKKYNRSLFQSWWYYITGRKYSAGQLLEIWTQLRSSEWSSIDNIEERERRVLDYLLKNKFKSFTEVDDARCVKIVKNSLF